MNIPLLAVTDSNNIIGLAEINRLWNSRRRHNIIGFPCNANNLVFISNG